MEPSLAGESNAHPTIAALVASDDGAPRRAAGTGPGQLAQLRLGEWGMCVSLVRPCQQCRECSPVRIAQVAEVDDGHLHVHVGQRNPIP